MHIHIIKLYVFKFVNYALTHSQNSDRDFFVDKNHFLIYIKLSVKIKFKFILIFFLLERVRFKKQI